MQIDFHYYATYCAAYLAGYTHEESLDICYSAQFVDCCSETLLTKVGGPKAGATTQLQLELMDARTDIVGIHNITRIWAPFHFLPRDLNAPVNKGIKRYRDKYRLICGPNGRLVKDTVDLARGKSLESVGIAMHVVADTWAHRNFCGTPSLVINNTNYFFYERIWNGKEFIEEKVKFKHNPSAPDDIENRVYVNSIFQSNENSVMNLGHGRAGHLPDYSFARYRYLPAWGDYEEVVKDNPTDYYRAFIQMTYAMRCVRAGEEFLTDRYPEKLVSSVADDVKKLLQIRRMDASSDWKALGERLSGRSIPDFGEDRYEEEYITAEDKENTGLGRFVSGALAHQSMVCSKIYESGNRLVGIVKRQEA